MVSSLICFLMLAFFLSPLRAFRGYWYAICSALLLLFGKIALIQDLTSPLGRDELTTHPLFPIEYNGSLTGPNNHCETVVSFGI